MSMNEHPLHTLSKDELIARIEQFEEEKRMGTVFSTVGETSAADATLQWLGRNRFLNEQVKPVTLIPSLYESFQQDKGDHEIINGDNLSVMASLLSRYRGGRTRGVDVVYMDPPYNTGNDVFSYNDDYRLTNAEVRNLKRVVKQTEHRVSLDDPTRHTKWINHIAPRLWSARKLLKSTGVIIVSIDEHELPRLWILMEEMFGPNNRIATLIWERSRKNDAKYISEGHEYLLVWAMNKSELDDMAKTKGPWRKRKDGADEILNAYRDARSLHGDDLEQIQSYMNDFFKELSSNHPAKKSKFKKADLKGVYRDDGDLSWPGSGGPRYEVLHPITKKPCAIPKRGWIYAKQEDIQKLADEGRVNFGTSHAKIPSLITYIHEQEFEVRTSVLNFYGQNSVRTIAAILGESEFKNPKDHEMLAEIFQLVTWNDPNAVFLDPYAGSGTTGQAVIELNALDGGKRKFILIENGDPTANGKNKRERKTYTDQLTAERIRRVITGEWADGKVHPSYETGFTFLNANGVIDRKAIMTATRENLADIILQVADDDSNRIDCRLEGDWRYLVGRTRLGYGIALVWEGDKPDKSPALTMDILDDILDETREAGLTKPVYIYAVARACPTSDELFRFQQIPDSILARLGLLPGDEDE